MLREYLKLLVEMQELWLLTRIRRDDYWFLGDLRALGPRSVQVAKLTWSRVHTAVAMRIASAHRRLDVGADVLSATMHERLDVVRDTLGSRAELLRNSLGERADALLTDVDTPMSSADRPTVGVACVERTALADLRLPALPAVVPEIREVVPVWDDIIDDVNARTGMLDSL